MLRRVPIARKLPVAFVALTSLSAFLIGILSYTQMQTTMEQQAVEKLSAARRSISHDVEQHFDHFASAVDILASDSGVSDMLTEFSKALVALKSTGQDPLPYLRNAYVEGNPFPAGERLNYDEAPDCSIYSIVHGTRHERFKTITKEQGYVDMMLVNNNGTVIYSVAKGPEFATNLETGPWKDTELAKAVQAVLRSDASGQTTLSGFAPYAADDGRPTAFMARVLYNKLGQPLGTIVARLPEEPFVALLAQDYGLGKSTCAFVIGPDHLIRFMHEAESEVGEHSADNFVGTEEAELAMHGEPGTMIEVESDGEKEIMAYGMIESHGLKYGLIVDVYYDEIMQPAYGLRNVMMVVVGVTVILTVLGGVLFARSIVNPLTRMQQKLCKIAETRDLSIRVGGSSEDEVGKSAQAVDDILKLVEGSLQDIKDGTVQVGEIAEQVATASQLLATNSEIQSSSVEELSSSIDQTGRQAKSNAAAAKSASDLVLGTSEIVTAGKEKIAEMVSAMQEINESSRDIAKIIKVIDEIAFQTNLLALNAAVEAARAGPHGRGFAVVATEVRNLAGRSAKAAKETSDLIKGSSLRVEAGVEISSETREAFERIASDIGEITQLAGEISDASDDQTNGVDLISVGILEISNTFQEGSNQAEELATTAAELFAANRSVGKQVDQFKLSGGVPNGIELNQPPRRPPEVGPESGNFRPAAAPETNGARADGTGANGTGANGTGANGAATPSRKPAESLTLCGRGNGHF